MIRDGVTFTVAGILLLLSGLLGWWCAFRRERRFGEPRGRAARRAIGDGLMLALVLASAVVALLTAPEAIALGGKGWGSYAVSMVMWVISYSAAIWLSRRLQEAIDRWVDRSS